MNTLIMLSIILLAIIAAEACYFYWQARKFKRMYDECIEKQAELIAGTNETDS